MHLGYPRWIDHFVLGDEALSDQFDVSSTHSGEWHVGATGEFSAGDPFCLAMAGEEDAGGDCGVLMAYG